MRITSPIAVIPNQEGQDTQALFLQAATAWSKAGIKVAAVIAQNNTADGACSAGFLHDLATGKMISIQLAQVPVNTSCHLDSAGVNQAGAGLLAQIPQADVVVLSKFGKIEAQHEGLWEAFMLAGSSGKPILTSVSPKQLEAFKALAPDAAWLDASTASISQWWLALRQG